MPSQRELKLQIEREHAILRNAIEDIRGELSRLKTEKGPAHTSGKLSGMLQMFEHHLRRHFELEEEGGFLVEHAELNPGINRRIRQLRAEHAALASRVASLRRSIDRTDAGAACLPDAFVESLGSFLAELWVHEQAENELLQELVYRDVGAGD